MAQMTLYGLKNCDTCKKALKALEAADHDVAFVDIRSEANLSEKIPAWLAAAGAETLINKRSTTWRSLTDAERESAASENAASLVESNATLVKRPVIEANGSVYVGWAKDVSSALT